MERAVTFRTIMNDPYREHPSEDALERFLLSHSDEEELEIVETHVLACEPCVTRLEVIELNLAAVKRALKDLEAERIRFIPQPASRVERWLGWLSLPKLSFAGAAVICAIALTFFAVPRDIQLAAERGNQTASVQEWVPLRMHLQAQELADGPVTVSIVNNAGTQIWERESSVRHGDVVVTTPRLTASGSYVIRIYSPVAGDARGDLIHEYSLLVDPLF